jgi:hypothetical protein
LRTYRLAVRVIAQLYPPLTNQRRWAFQNAVAPSRGHPAIRAAARWDQLDEAAVTIQCQARDAAAAAGAARAMIRRTARLTGQIGIRDIKITGSHPPASSSGPDHRIPSHARRDPGPSDGRGSARPAAGKDASLQRQKLTAGEQNARLTAKADVQPNTGDA